MRPERLEQNRLIAVERHRQTLKLRRAVAELLPQQHRPAFHLGSREHVVRLVAVAVAAYVLRQPGGPCDSHEPVLRSEEHTSELQSLMRISYAVFCLNKKTTQKMM